MTMVSKDIISDWTLHNQKKKKRRRKKEEGDDISMSDSKLLCEFFFIN